MLTICDFFERMLKHLYEDDVCIKLCNERIYVISHYNQIHELNQFAPAIWIHPGRYDKVSNVFNQECSELGELYFTIYVVVKCPYSTQSQIVNVYSPVNGVVFKGAWVEGCEMREAVRNSIKLFNQDDLNDDLIDIDFLGYREPDEHNEHLIMGLEFKTKYLI